MCCGLLSLTRLMVPDLSSRWCVTANVTPNSSTLTVPCVCVSCNPVVRAQEAAGPVPRPATAWWLVSEWGGLRGMEPTFRDVMGKTNKNPEHNIVK